jgi:tetratricopeptide (TPR) repeat protein
MGLLKIFSGKTAEEIEEKGDSLARSKSWGAAKIEFEKALIKLEKKSPEKDRLKKRLEEKIARTREELASEHRQVAEDMIEAGYYEDARPYIDLALELTGDPQLKDRLESLSQNLDEGVKHQKRSDPSWVGVYHNPEGAPAERKEENEEFSALVSSLPEEIQQAYLGYGDDFKIGYLALNEGDFEQAASHLSRAWQDNPSPESFIPLELATAFLNLEQYDEARTLLEAFLRQRPDALPAYQMLCEIFWETRAFEDADALLASVPDELTESLAMVLLRGESFFHAEKYPEAREYYQNFLDEYGWNESIAKALAKAHEALNETEDARGIYSEIMDQCQSCRAYLDPFVKLKYADLSFSSGIYTVEILELYLSLAREFPENAPAFYQNISRIYEEMGNEAEAERFRLIAEDVDSSNLLE